MKRLTTIYLLLNVLLISSTLVAQQPETREAAAPIGISDALMQLNNFTNGLKAFSASFEQNVYDGLGNNEETSSGNLHLSQPNLLRWEYVTPFPQIIVADGERVWNYDVELEQITVQAQDDAQSQSPLTLLTRPKDLYKSFVLRALENRDGLAWLEMLPHAESENDSNNDFARILLGLRNNQLRVMSLEDNLGQRTEITFTRGQRNLESDGQLFVFLPPPGVDVLESDF